MMRNGMLSRGGHTAKGTFSSWNTDDSSVGYPDAINWVDDPQLPSLFPL
jgi:hypothetical protein